MILYTPWMIQPPAEPEPFWPTWVRLPLQPPKRQVQRRWQHRKPGTKPG